MAEFINDGGAYNQDAEFNGVNGTDYDFSEANEIIWFSSTGTADTGLTLPDSEWILYEVYAPESYTNPLTGGTTVQGKKEWTSDIGTSVTTTIGAWYTAYDAATPFTTNYKVKATHYKGNDLADVYYADEGESFSLTGGTEEGIEDGAYTGHGSEWVISDALLADDVSGLRRPAYIAFYGTTHTEPDPTGVYINVCHNSTTTVQTLLDIDEETSDFTTQIKTSNWDNGYGCTACMTGTGCVSDKEIQESIRHTYTSTAQEIDIYLPIGTFDVKVSSYGATTDDDVVDTIFSFDGTNKTIAGKNGSSEHCGTWTVTVSTAGYYALGSKRVGTSAYAMLNSIRITEVTP